MGRNRQRQSEKQGLLSESERTRIRDSFGWVLLLLTTTVFFSIAAPDEPWAWLATAVILAVNLRTAMLASGASSKVVLAWSVFAVLGIGTSIFIAIAQVRAASGYLALITLLLALVTIGAISRRL